MDVSQKLKPTKVIAKTGKTLNDWFKIIEKFGAKKGHTAIAKLLKEDYKLTSWWAQSITTRYEFENDLRKLYQRTGKSGFTITVQKTMPYSLEVVYDVFTNPKQLKKWFSPYLKMTVKDGAEFNFDQVTKGKFINVIPNSKIALNLVSYKNEEVSKVTIDFIKKDKNKTVLKITQSDLTTEIAITAQKDFWKNFLSAGSIFLKNVVPQKRN